MTHPCNSEYVLVPRKPTAVMVSSVEDWRMRADGPRYVWAAMLAAEGWSADLLGVLKDVRGRVAIIADLQGSADKVQCLFAIKVAREQAADALAKIDQALPSPEGRGDA